MLSYLEKKSLQQVIKLRELRWYNLRLSGWSLHAITRCRQRHSVQTNTEWNDVATSQGMLALAGTEEIWYGFFFGASRGSMALLILSFQHLEMDFAFVSWRTVREYFCCFKLESVVCYSCHRNERGRDAVGISEVSRRAAKAAIVIYT